MIGLEGVVKQAISAAAEREAGSYAPVFHLVPGWVLRGALASRWIREHGRPVAGSARRNEFLDLFEGSLRYGPMVVAGSSIEPLSVAGCKYPKGEECSVSFIDLAFADATSCPKCGGPLEPLKGAVRGVKVAARARVSLDASERAHDGSLFTREEIPAGVTVKGMVDGDHPWLAGLANEPVWFGGRRSTAGRVDVTAASAVVEQPKLAAGGMLVVRCTSPLISVDGFARPLLEPAVRELAQALGVDESAIRMRQRFVRPVTVGGWHLASALPKPREIAAAAGSTFVYEVDGVSESGLRRLAGVGLGLRQREGFGWIEVNPVEWSPPTTVSSAKPQRTDLPSNALLQLDDRDRRWAVEHLRDRLLRLETSSQPVSNDVDGTARFALLTAAQQGELTTALGSADAPAIRRLIETLRGNK